SPELYPGYHVKGRPFELAAPLERRDFQQEAPPGDVGTQGSRQLTGGPGRAAGGEDVVHHQHSRSVGPRIPVSLERVLPVLEVVALPQAFPWQLAGLAGRNEPCPEHGRYRAAQNETP